jgi:hypothetical protein
MTNFKILLAKLMLAVMLIGGGGQALAGPTFMVSIDTSTLGTGPAYLGLYFSSLAGAVDATALVNHLSGDFIGAAMTTGPVTGTAPGPLAFSNQGGYSELVQGITLGGVFSFDLQFLLTAAGDVGSTFGWALFNDTAYLGADGDLGTVSLNPGAVGGARWVLSSGSTLNSVQVVPEPSSIALMLLACCALAMTSRRQR